MKVELKRCKGINRSGSRCKNTELHDDLVKLTGYCNKHQKQNNSCVMCGSIEHLEELDHKGSNNFICDECRGGLI